MLFDGEKLFADARTLVDSSINVSVTAEDIRGGEGNKLWGRYFHDSAFGLKLTDAMFNLEYLAAHVGAEIENSGSIFKTESPTLTGGQLTLTQAPVPVVTNGTVKVFYRLADANGDMEETDAIAGNIVTIEDGVEGAKYCVMYRYNDTAAQTLTVNAQFIPKTLAVALTVALYSGDSCEAETATKVGEVEIFVPRFQLSGTVDLAMTASGASQTSLEGTALASGCEGCDGDGIYATITKVLFNANWYDNVEGLVIEDAHIEITAGEDPARQLVVYAYYKSGAPKQISADKLNFAIEPAVGLGISETGMLSGAAVAGTGVITVSAKGKADLTATGVVEVAAVSNT